ncbi:MAG TPA: D-glycero-beta-D-manno-heptose-7-phosphate kinase [Burkholderiaceae bacterium]
MTPPAARPILVVGDSMLDRYWEGRVDRLSPEAPVPILRVTSESSRVGGAGNVALNVAALGAPVTLLTLVGADEAGDVLSGLLRRGGVTLHAVGGHRHRTTQKIRCVAQRHQLLRTDFEDLATDDCCRALLQQFSELLPERAIVVLSDYAKGALRDCPEMIALARSRGCTVLVDPKGSDFRRYRHADLVKPNAAELRAVVGDWRDERELQRKCASLRRRLALGTLMVTRGEEGLSLFGAAGARHHRAEAREVFDVCGAGDTVIAALARFLAAGCPLDDSARWANRAAGVAVSRFGTTAVTLAELGLSSVPSHEDADAGERAQAHGPRRRAAASHAEYAQ